MQYAMLHCSLRRNDNAVSWLVSSPGRIFSARNRSPEPSHKTDAECRAAIGTLARQPTTNSKIFGNPLIIRDPAGHRAIRNLGQSRESRIREVICGRSIPDIRSPPQLWLMGAGTGLSQAHTAAEDRAREQNPELVTETHDHSALWYRKRIRFFPRRILESQGRLGRHSSGNPQLE